MKIKEVHDAIELSSLSKYGAFNSRKCFWLEMLECSGNNAKSPSKERKSMLNDVIKNLTKLVQQTEVQVVAVLVLCKCTKILRSFNKVINQWLDSILLIILV